MNFIEALKDPAFYPHPVRDILLIETHISWVFLTGDYVYKIKKPVNFGFLDFSTLDKRAYFCHEEVRLNRRLAPDIYLGVVSITGTMEQPVLGGSDVQDVLMSQSPGRGESDARPIEYAVHMRQFDHRLQFDLLLAEKRLTHMDLLQATETIAAFHLQAQHAGPDSAYGDAQTVHQPVLENFQAILQHDLNTDDIEDVLSSKLKTRDESDDKQRIVALRDAAQRQFEALRQHFARRKADGFIRECHGDMHLRNMALHHGRALIFDCIEFNPNLRWIDVISDLAFLVMDLQDRGRSDLANAVLNRYLEITGDYAGVVLLPYYLSYRAMVRAKVAILRADQAEISCDVQDVLMSRRPGRGESDGLATQIRTEFRGYLQLAESYIRPKRPLLLLMHGFSGSGKSVVSSALISHFPIVRVRSDVERKRLYALAATASSGSGIDDGIYSQKAGEATYRQLAHSAHSIVIAGYSAVMDAAFLKRRQRRLFYDLARTLHCELFVIHCECPWDELERRVQRRALQRTDASEADLAVLRHQRQTEEPFEQEELAHVLHVTTAGEPSPLHPYGAWIERLKHHGLQAFDSSEIDADPAR